jgi:hypothetical protein
MINLFLGAFFAAAKNRAIRSNQKPGQATVEFALCANSENQKTVRVFGSASIPCAAGNRYFSPQNPHLLLV